MFIRKIFGFSVGSASFYGISRAASLWSTVPEINQEFLEKVYRATENLADISLSSSVDPNVEKVSSPFIYSLFSTNLSSFSKYFKESFESWYLFEWANSFLKKTNGSSFSKTKETIFNKFLELKNSHSTVPKAELTPKNWLQRNHIISSSKETLKGLFNEIFFKEIYLEDKNGAKNFGITEDRKKPYGDDLYMDQISSFQKHVFDFWLREEKPRLFCRKSWDYSATFGSPSIYKKNEEGLTLPVSPNFRFPDLHDKKDEINKFTNKEINEVCGNGDFSLHTISDISKVDDGYELSGFLYRYKEKENLDGKFERNKSDLNNKDPLEIFIVDSVSDDSNGEHGQWKLNSEIIDDSGPLKDSKSNKILLNLANIKSTKSSKDHYGTFLRTKKGITFLYRDPSQSSEEEIKKSLLKKLSSEDKFKLKDRLKDYFHSHHLEILGDYLNSEKGKNKDNIFLHRSWASGDYDLLKSLSEYMLQAERNKSHWKMLETLSRATAEFKDIKFTDNKPDKSAGLATPLQLTRNLSKDAEIEEIENLDEKNKTQNDGDFEEMKNVFGEERKSLKKPADAIRNHLVSFINSRTLREKPGLKSSHFFEDYLLDNIYHEFKKQNGLLRNSTLAIYFLNKLNVKLNNSEKPIFSFGEGDDKTIKAFNEVVGEEMVEGFIAHRYMAEKIEDRLNYGGFKYDSKECIREITEMVAEGETPQSPSCKRRDQFNRKLKNYWHLKNHYFNEYAHELNSGEMHDYLRFLFSVKSMVENNFEGFRRLLSSRISPGGFGALVWINEVKNVNGSNGNSKPGENETVENVTSLKNPQNYFKTSEDGEIFNPFFSRKIKISEYTVSGNSTAGSISSYAGLGEKKRELFGFGGFYGEAPKDDGLGHVWKAVFDGFQKSNPAGNKNYSSSSESSPNASVGSAYGYGYGSSDIGDIVDAFKKKETLEDFLKYFFNDEYQKINKELPTNGNLETLKKEAKKHLKNEDFNSKFKDATTRFSGFLQNSDSSEGIFRNQKYFIPKSKDSNEGHMVYVVQVNKYDLGKGFSEFLKTIGFRTLLKTLILLAAKERAIANEFVDLVI